MNYQAGIYSKLYKTEIGQELWNFLTREDILLRMKTASDLRKPAVEGILTQLDEVFADKLPDLQTKQMIGHMIRQIMESEGYKLNAQNVKISRKGIFSRVSRYTKA